jgi:hypothetical protein
MHIDDDKNNPEILKIDTKTKNFINKSLGLPISVYSKYKKSGCFIRVFNSGQLNLKATCEQSDIAYLKLSNIKTIENISSLENDMKYRIRRCNETFYDYNSIDVPYKFIIMYNNYTYDEITHIQHKNIILSDIPNVRYTFLVNRVSKNPDNGAAVFTILGQIMPLYQEYSKNYSSNCDIEINGIDIKPHIPKRNKSKNNNNNINCDIKLSQKFSKIFSTNQYQNVILDLVDEISSDISEISQFIETSRFNNIDASILNITDMIPHEKMELLNSHMDKVERIKDILMKYDIKYILSAKISDWIQYGQKLVDRYIEIQDSIPDENENLHHTTINVHKDGIKLNIINNYNSSN